jgi:hypothetical protein
MYQEGLRTLLKAPFGFPSKAITLKSKGGGFW